MRKNLLNSFLIVMLMAFCGSLKAQDAPKWLLCENFNYSVGNLKGNGTTLDPNGLGWISYGTNTESPIQVVNNPLTYTGYQDEATGKAVKLQPTNLGQDLQIGFTAASSPILSGDLYASFLINVEDATDADTYSIAFTTKNYNGWVEGVNATEYFRLFIVAGSDETKFKIGISKANNATISDKSNDLNIGETYLIVMKYTVVDGSPNDIVKVWINPTISSTEPTATLQATQTSGDISATNGLVGIELRQGTTATKTAATFYVDALRIATKWEDLFGKSSDGPNPPPTSNAQIAIDKTSLTFEGYVGAMEGQKIHVSGSDLTGAISIAASKANVVKLSASSISKEEATNGVDITITPMAGLTEGEHNITLTLSSEGAENKTVNVSITAYTAISLMTLLNFYNSSVDTQDYTPYCMTGQAVVTYIDGDKVYIEQTINHAGAVLDLSVIKQYYAEYLQLQVGDKIQNLYVYLLKSFGNVTAYPLIPNFATVKSKGNTVTPLELTFSEWKEDQEYYPYALITVKDVNFGAAEGGTFASQSYDVSDGSGSAKIKPFANTDLIGESIPKSATVTGISLSQVVQTLAPRSKADIADKTSGINDIKANDTEGVASYVDLLGRKVTNPKGVVIRVVGNDRTKVFIP